MSEAKQETTEPEQVSVAVGALLGKVQAVKGSLFTFVDKMERDQQINWPSVLDSFASLSATTSTLMRTCDKLPRFNSHILLPLQVSSDHDPELEKATEGRIPVLHHEALPNYLRTKLDLELEARQKEVMARAREQEKEEGARERIGRFNDIIAGVLDRVNEARLERDEQKGTGEVATPNTSAETRKLVAAYIHGQGISLSNSRKAILSGSKPRGGGGGKAPSSMRASVSVTPNPYPTSSPAKR